jgi:hypothetical protein
MICTGKRSLALLLVICIALVVAGCGSDSGNSQLLSPGPVPVSVIEAEHVDVAAFPSASGKTLSDLALNATTGVQFAAANGTFLPGSNRLAFALIGQAGKFVYAPTVVYVAHGDKAPATGPYAAVTDPIVPKSAYLSTDAAADTAQLKAIYESQVRLPQTGKWSILTLTKTPQGMVGSTSRLEVVKSSRIPNVGQKAVPIHTATVTGPGPALSKIETRIPAAPAAPLHSEDFGAALGKKPIALLFATPLLCQSRVCGPVTDLLLQLQGYYGNKVAAIHQEVYANNQVKDGLTPQMQAYNLETEPWLFTIGTDGLIKARLEGAFGINAMNNAIKAAIGK